MIDFKKHLAKPSGEKLVNPIDIYERLDRASDKGPLRPAQLAVLEEWHTSRRRQQDTIVKLNTGQGKTLVGLLMLQSCMNENEGPGLYLCPNNFLVSQTTLQARQFGIHCVTSDPELPTEFLDGKAILVTSIQKLFNGLSKFRLGPQSLSVANIVVDDAHTCIDAIKDAFTIKLRNDTAGYREIVDLFSVALEEQGAGTYAEIRQKQYGAFLPVPYWEWMDKQSELVGILARNLDSDGVKFTWPLIKDTLRDCLCVVSGNELQISPYHPPLHMFGSYAKAKHRFYMSATIADDSFLIRGLAIPEAAVNNPLTYAGEKWSGERMILMPTLIDSLLTEDVIVSEFAKTSPAWKSGIVVLCPSFAISQIWKGAGAHVAATNDIEHRIEQLRSGVYDQTLVVANRYDGIDLPDDACRILILYGKPFSEQLLDRYVETCREGSDVVALRLTRTIEQGLGRSVRGEKDYSVVLLVGSELVMCVHTKEARRFFSEQTRAQIDIGRAVAALARDQQLSTDVPSVDLLRSLIQQCLRRDEGWKDYYFEKMNEGVVSPYTPPKILHIFSSEMRAEEKYHQGDPEAAAQIIQDILDKHVSTISEKGWYLQEMARFIYPVSKSRSNLLQIAAHKHNRYLLRPKDGMVVTTVSMISQKRIENIIMFVREIGTIEELLIKVSDLTVKLQFGVKADTFEKALDDLAKALGFVGQRPDKEWKAGPDNLWAVRDGEYILFECKSEVSEDRSEINKDETGQMNNSSAWFGRHYPGAKVTRIMIIPTKKVNSAGGFIDDVLIMRDHHLRHLVRNVTSFYNEFRTTDLSSLSETKVQEFLDLHHLAVVDLVSRYADDPKSA